MRNPIKRPSPAMIVAFISLAVALGGVAGALPGVNSVDSGDIKNGQVRTPDLRNNAVTSAKVANDNLGGGDINESSLSQVPSAASATTATTATSATNANFATSAGSAPDTTFNGGPLASGQVMRGIWSLFETDDGSSASSLFGAYSFPVPVPTGLASGVNIGMGTKDNSGAGSVAGLIADVREDPACTGTFFEPTAPAGKLCIYVRSDAVFNIAADSVASFPASTPAGNTASRLGFGMVATEGAATTFSRVEGSWAFTAP